MASHLDDILHEPLVSHTEGLDEVILLDLLLDHRDQRLPVPVVVDAARNDRGVLNCVSYKFLYLLRKLRFGRFQGSI